MKGSFFSKLGKVFFCCCFIIIIFNIFCVNANISNNVQKEITITIDNNGYATMVTKNTNNYLINPYKGFSVDDNPVLQEGNILTSKISYDDYWNSRNGLLATEGYARFNWYQFYDNTFIKPNNTRNYKDSAYNWDALKNFIIVCIKNGIDARFGIMTANTTSTDSAYGKTDAYSLSKLQEHIMPAGSVMPDGSIVKEGKRVYKARNTTPMWMFEGIPVGYNNTTNEYIYDTNNDVSYYLDNKELQWIPSWDDKNLIKNIDDFVYSLSQYLKNEEYAGKKLIEYISFVEVRSYGNYGENHLTGINNNAKFLCGNLDLTKYPTYSYVEPVSCYVTNNKGNTYNVYENSLFNGKTRYSINVSAEYYYDNYLTTYLNAFRNTNVNLVINWAAIWDSTYNSTDGFMPNGKLRKWIEDNKGYLTIRSDSIFLNSFGDARQLYVSNGIAPSSFEYVFSTYKKNHNNDNNVIKNNITKDLIQVIQNGRATYMDFSDDLYTYYVNNFNDYESEIAKFGNTLGYYFRLKQAKYNINVVSDKENNLNIDLFFVNEGVSKLYDKGDSKVYIALLETDSKGNVLYNNLNKAKVVAKYLTDINPTEWNSNFVSTDKILDPSNPNNWINESLKISVKDVASGNYMLAVGLFTDYDKNNPTIKLGNTGATLDNWYTLGTIEIEPIKHTSGNPVKENVVEATAKKEGSYELVIYCTQCGKELRREKKTTPKFVYEIIEKDELYYKDKDSDGITIKSNGKFDKFKGIKINGKVVDNTNYIAKEGSTIILLKPDYLDTLTLGEHKIVLIYDDGEIETKFKILNELENNNQENNNNDQDAENNNQENDNNDQNTENNNKEVNDDKEESNSSQTNDILWKVVIIIFGILIIIIIGWKIKSSIKV